MTPGARARRDERHQAARMATGVRLVDLNASPDGLGKVVVAINAGTPRLAFINLKTRATSIGSRSGFSGHRTEQLEGNIENASRILATEIDKILNPKEEETPDGKEIESAIEGRVNPQEQPRVIES